MSINNILSVYERSTEYERSHGKIYYRTTHDRILSHIAGYGTHISGYVITAERAIGAFCALSPNNDESGNYRDLVTVIAASHKRMQFEDFSVSTWAPNKLKAWRILRYGESPLKVLGGDKVRSFYRNILNPLDPVPVTIDGHCYNIYRGERRPLVSRRKTQTGEVKISPAVDEGLTYKEVARAYRSAAMSLEILPNQLQATVWHTWKRIHNILYNPQIKMFDEFRAVEYIA